MQFLTRRKTLKRIVGVFSSSVVLSQKAWSVTEPKEHRIRITKFKFIPDEIEVQIGDKVIWVNEDLAPHTATAKDSSWTTGKLKRNDEEIVEISEGMSGSYFCKYHPNMKATLIIN